MAENAVAGGARPGAPRRPVPPLPCAAPSLLRGRLPFPGSRAWPLARGGAPFAGSDPQLLAPGGAAALLLVGRSPGRVSAGGALGQLGAVRRDLGVAVRARAPARGRSAGAARGILRGPALRGRRPGA